MTIKKFVSLLAIMFLLFTAVFANSGCGGGSNGPIVGNQTQSDDSNPTPETNPSPIQEQEKVSSVIEYAASCVTIGYQNGDSSRSVTKKLELPATVDNFENITVTWTSDNPSVISTNGDVSRQAVDTSVTLTAKISDKTEETEREFRVLVIRQRSRSVEEAKALPVHGVDEIRNMNTDNDLFQISYNTSRDKVTDIDGKYSDIKVFNADDALDSIQTIRGILGINDPYTELENSISTSDSYGGEYTFNQVHDGVRVYGRNVTVSANSDGDTDFISSNFVASETLNNANLNFIFTEQQVENFAKEYYLGNFDVRKGTEKIIFTLENYENNPVPAYIVNIYGVDDEGNHIDENLFINALNGNEVIFSTSNIHSYSVKNITAYNELDELKVMPVAVASSETETTYFMLYTDPENPEIKIAVFNQNTGTENLARHVEGSMWRDKQQVSAYTNMIEIMKWWKASFDRNSLDDNGMLVNVITHEHVEDNAYWSGIEEKILVCDPQNDSRSGAADIATLAHESTHAVLQYNIDRFRNGHDNFPYSGATGAINEGYADIFGALKVGHWYYGLHVLSDDMYERNLENPHDPSADQNIFLEHRNDVNVNHSPRIYSERYVGTFDYSGAHINSSLISYPAYLMYHKGMSWNDLGKLWYKSMRMGYNATSNFFTVRRNVLRAANKMHMSEENINRIKEAFDEVEITATVSTLSGKVSVYRGSPLAHVGITVNPVDSRRTLDVPRAITDSNGNFNIILPVGDYSVDITQSGYVPFKALKKVEEGVSNILNVSLVTPSGSQPSNLSGVVRDALTGEVIEGAYFQIRSGWNIHTGYTTAECLSEANGSYTIPMLAGYYTVDVSKEGYDTTKIDSLVIPADTSVRQDILLSPISDNKYRVTLQWDQNPNDLDAHLIGPLPNNGRNFHVYYFNKTARDSQGNIVANLDHDDTKGYGFETITFEMKPGDKFKYYVNWYGGSGTWNASNAVVNLYKAGHIISTFHVPVVNSGSIGEYWYVFDLTSGMNPVQVDSISRNQPSLNE